MCNAEGGGGGETAAAHPSSGSSSGPAGRSGGGGGEDDEAVAPHHHQHLNPRRQQPRPRADYRDYSNDLFRRKNPQPQPPATTSGESFEVRGKTFVAGRVDVFTELILAASGGNDGNGRGGGRFGFLYLATAATSLCLLVSTALLADDDHAWDSELLLARQMWAARRHLLGFLAAFCTCALAVYPCVRLWNRTRTWARAKSSAKGLLTMRRAVDLSGAAVLALFLVGFYAVSGLAGSLLRLPAAPAICVFLEQTVFTLKIYAFVHWNVTEVTEDNDDNDDNDDDDSGAGSGKNEKGRRAPKLRNYIYFLCAPTFVYRDSYPRTPGFSPGQFAATAAELLVATHLLNHALCRHYLPAVRAWRQAHPAAGHGFCGGGSAAFVSLVAGTVPATLFLTFGTGFLLFHCVCNLAAEATTFADRAFQRDFWNCSTVRRAASLWNIPVHDWLYEYVYRPAHRHRHLMRLRLLLLPAAIIGRSSRTASALPVMLVSYLFHELVVVLALRSFELSFVPFYSIALFCLVFLDPLRSETSPALNRLKMVAVILSLSLAYNAMFAHLYVKYALDGHGTWDEQVEGYFSAWWTPLPTSDEPTRTAPADMSRAS